MRIMTIDVETAWNTDYSLSKMSPLAYVMDERFELQSLAIKLNHYPTDVFFGEPEIRRVMDKIDWSDTMIVAHNANFDAYVLAYRLGIRPKMWACTLAMARPLHAKTCGLSLARLVAHYGLGVKDNTVLMQTKGRYLKDFTPDEIDQMREYNKADVEQCYALFKKLLPHYNSSELWQIDALVRMRTEPQFELDAPMLETAASIERVRKHAALLDLAKLLQLDGVEWGDEDSVAERVRSEMASAAKFGALLQTQGVEVPMKPSPTNLEKEVPALAKTDEAFIDLQDHDNPIVAAAARTRLDVKSTLLETRIQKFLTAGRLAGGMIPVPLRYCGADTTGRDSGEEMNMQNLPRIGPVPRPSDALRNSLRAPKGFKVIVADQSGIEMRVNHFLWKVASSMALFQDSPDKADLYRAFAAVRFGKKPEEITKEQRQFGKICQLGLGFGSGAVTFRRIAKTMGGLDIDQEDAVETVQEWREEYHAIVGGWKLSGQGVLDIARGVKADVDPWGLVKTQKEGFLLPSGRLVRYPDLRQDDDGEWPDGRPKTSWFYAHGRHKARITGPKACENLVQALARDSIFDCAVDYYKLTGLRPALRVHDELVYVVPEAKAEGRLAQLQAQLRTPPKWWPELIVHSEGDVAQTYGQAK